MAGGTGNDSLIGGEGSDILNGGGGGDDLHGGAAGDNLNGNGGGDMLLGGLGSDNLDGGRGNDRLFGGGGGDWMEGGLGVDVMTGGAGGDTFVFLDASDSGAEVGVRDRITDFESGNDSFDFSELMLSLGLTGQIVSVFSGAAGEVVLEQGAVNLDLNGDGIAEMIIDVDFDDLPATILSADISL